MRYDTTKVERAIVRKMIRRLGAAGFTPTHVHDGDAMRRAFNERRVMALVFAVDISRIYFAHPTLPGGSVLLVGGNGEDVISDYSYDEQDTTFANALDAIIDEMIAAEAR